MTPHTKLGVAGVIVGLILLGFIPAWLALLVIVLAIAIPTLAWLMLDPAQRWRYREFRRRQRQIRRGQAKGYRQDFPTKPILKLSNLEVTPSPSEAERLLQRNTLTSGEKGKPGPAASGAQAPVQRRETTQGSGSWVGSGGLTGSGPLFGPGLAAVVTITIDFIREGARLEDNESARAGTDGHDVGLPGEPGRLLIKREAIRLYRRSDIDMIESLCREYQDLEDGTERREEIKAATAEYAASWVEGKCIPTCWESSRSFPLDEAAKLLDGSTEWLHGLVVNPLTDVASMAGLQGPMVEFGAGVTANFVMAPETALLGIASRVCEIAGVVIGAATGAWPLVIINAKLLAHDLIGEALAKEFEQAINNMQQGPGTAEDTRRLLEEANFDARIHDLQVEGPRQEIGPEEIRPNLRMRPPGPDIWGDSFGL
jgi:hypothetical protein